MALLLALARKSRCPTGWCRPGAGRCRRWCRTGSRGVLGLIGLGNIPRKVVPKAQAFGLRVITHDPYVSPDVVKPLGVENVSFDELLVKSDFISVHAPLLPADARPPQRPGLRQDEKSVLIINTARGPLIDEPALVQALDQARSAAPPSTCWRPSRRPRDFPLRGRDNVILSPHTAFYSVDALESCRPSARATSPAC